MLDMVAELNILNKIKISMGKYGKKASNKGPNLTSLFMGSHYYKKGGSHHSSKTENPTGNSILGNGVKIARNGKLENLDNKIDIERKMGQDSERDQSDIANEKADCSDEESTKTVVWDSYRNGELSNTADITGNAHRSMSQDMGQAVVAEEIADDSGEEMIECPQEVQGQGSAVRRAAGAAGEQQLERRYSSDRLPDTSDH